MNERYEVVCNCGLCQAMRLRKNHDLTKIFKVFENKNILQPIKTKQI